MSTVVFDTRPVYISLGTALKSSIEAKYPVNMTVNNLPTQYLGPDGNNNPVPPGAAEDDFMDWIGRFIPIDPTIPWFGPQVVNIVILTEFPTIPKDNDPRLVQLITDQSVWSYYHTRFYFDSKFMKDAGTSWPPGSSDFPSAVVLFQTWIADKPFLSYGGEVDYTNLNAAAIAADIDTYLQAMDRVSS